MACSQLLAKTRSPVQKPARKDLKPKWPKPSHLGLRPLMLRLLNAPAHALSSHILMYPGMSVSGNVIGLIFGKDFCIFRP
ncbi:hypothetical protein B4586_01735 [Lacticaseibacillus paracasei]|nr:hypothetical protein B4586_01735 [Lacticaseibacillus paracasei]